MTAHVKARRLVQLLREGRDYFTFAREETHDVEVSRVFARAELARRELLDALVQSQLIQQASSSVPSAALSSNIGYAHLQSQFDPFHPQTHAEALYERELILLQLIREVFHSDESEPLRLALKAHYSTFSNCADSLHTLVRLHEAA